MGVDCFSSGMRFQWAWVLLFSVHPFLELRGADVKAQPLDVPIAGQDGFSLLGADSTGVVFVNRLSDQAAAENQVRLNGSGVALGDVDGDGLVDIYFARLEGGNELYRNRGAWEFERVKLSLGAQCVDQYSTGVSFADLDGDADLDLLVNGLGVGTRFFRNDGKGGFSEAVNCGLLRIGGATSTAIADVDADGDLDVYVTRYRTTTIRTTGFALLRVGGKRVVRPQDRFHLEITEDGRVLEHGEPDTLYLNDGTGKFSPVSWTGGVFLDRDGERLVKPPFDWGLAAMFRDMDQDGDPDLYVCNDFHSEDRIWINRGDGRFQLSPTLSIRHTSTFSMAIDFADLNRDGWDDFFVADMLSLRHSRRMMQLAAMDPYSAEIGVQGDRPQFDRNTLQLNRGDGTYEEIAEFAGLSASDWTWSSAFLDVDLDGYEDLLCATGHMFDTQDLDAEQKIREKGPWPRHLIPSKLLMFPKMKQANVAFRNRGDLTFDELGQQWGFDQSGVSHGMAMGDLDNDGDLDLVVNNLNAPAGLYRNESNRPRILVRLAGAASNVSGIGARVTLKSDSLIQSQEILGGGRYLSSDDTTRMFAVVGTPKSLELEVLWPNGSRSALDGVRPNTAYVIGAEGAVTADTVAEKSNTRSWFRDVSVALRHRHHERPFEDFAQQVLLPRKYSQEGPGVVWFDWDHDGWDDLIVGSGRGGQVQVLRNRSGRFRPMDLSSNGAGRQRDQTGLAAFVDGEGRSQLVIGRSNYEDGARAGAAWEQFSANESTGSWQGFGGGQATGPLVVADFDGDGDLDIFVGAHARAKRFPTPDASSIWLNDDGSYKVDRENQAVLSGLGLVRGASAGDFTGNGQPDLLVVTDWGAIRLFVNRDGLFYDKSEDWLLGNLLGWWNGVATGDFDSDGRLDFVATNWGENHFRGNPFPSTNEGIATDVELRLRVGDFDGDRQRDLIMGYREKGTLYPVRHFSSMAADLSFLPSRFPSLHAYNEATLSDIIGRVHRAELTLDVNWFQHAVFLNRGEHFEANPLPQRAQFAPSFGVVVGDVNLDGHHDVFLAQNFFGVQPFTARIDAGRGLWLEGLGNGSFRAVAAEKSGVKIYGEQRGAALGDFDRDARLDLVVSQNGGRTLLFQNRVSRAGMRLRLFGAEKNPGAIGAAVRVRYGSRLGPVQEIRAGTGYWSQDSPVLVVPRDGATGIQVRWPDGERWEGGLDATSEEIWVRRDGTVSLKHGRN